MLFGANKLAGFLGRRYSLYLRPYCNKKGLCYEAHLFQYPLPSCQSILKISLLYLSIYSENLHSLLRWEALYDTYRKTSTNNSH